MTRHHRAVAATIVVLGVMVLGVMVLDVVVPVGVTATSDPTTTGPGPTTTDAQVTEAAPPPVIDELVDPGDRKPDGPGAWVGALALVGGLGVVALALALVRRRPVPADRLPPH